MPIHFFPVQKALLWNAPNIFTNAVELKCNWQNSQDNLALMWRSQAPQGSGLTGAAGRD